MFLTIQTQKQLRLLKYDSVKFNLLSYRKFDY